MGVSVIIVNYRTPALTVAAVQSALQQHECAEVIVVDNASGDESMVTLRKEVTDFRVKLIESRANLGFGRANNLAAEQASEEFLFLLNSDARFHPGCLGTLLNCWQDLVNPGILAPAVYLPDGQNLQADAIGPFPTVSRLITRKTKQYGTSLTPDWVSGCAMLIRRDDFLAVGGFDPDIFMYYEDVLLCHAIRKRGLEVARCLEAGVTHDGGASIESRLSRKAIYYEAQDVMLKKLGEASIGIFIVKLLRWPNLLIGRLLGRT
jgi:GT2 family glycosyltransferase